MRTQVYEMARRSVLQTLRQPALVIPPIVFPLIMMAINTGGLDAATDLPGFPADTYLDFDAMIAFFHSAYSTSPAMVIQMPGKGAQYLGGITDADGDYLTGEQPYRLHVPAEVPVLNYWSIVLYDADTRSLLDNGQPFPSIASNSNLESNPDGSADLFFGPEPPNDGNPNWIKTVPGRGWLAAIRLYSPTQAFFDQAWRPGNIEKAQ